jgi:oligopeptide/dipeptide ABC transporter ATP-binding protein
MSLLEVRNLKKYYPITSGLLSRHVGDIKAVDGVSFTIKEKETLGLVGESGCGKTTLAKTIVKLEKPTSGRIIYKGKDIYSLSKEEEKSYRKEVQMIFQDPHASLDPRMTAGDTVEEALIIHRLGDREERKKRVQELFRAVGLEAEHMKRYPHEFSGGQKQRIGIARALAVQPKLIIADEPVSALDVSVQAQILNLLAQLKEKFGLSYLFIAHNLSVIRYISDRVGVMYLGKIVEIAETEEIFDNPTHPYTRVLLEAAPIPDPRLRRNRRTLTREPSKTNEGGCRFYPSCHSATNRCSKEEPPLTFIEKTHQVACWRYI